jgi:hypothetical protein
MEESQRTSSGGGPNQVAVYQLLLRSVIEDPGGYSASFSPDALIVTPINMGFHPKSRP